MRTQTRVFGTVHYDQDPPVFTGITTVMDKEGAKYGWKPKVNQAYLLDLAKLPQTAAGLVAKLKQAGVTTVMFLGDPIMPIYLTKAATAQNYFPEWIVTGTVLTDTTAIARLYDQKQWAHAVRRVDVARPHRAVRVRRVPHLPLVLRPDARGLQDRQHLLPEPAPALHGRPTRRREAHAADVRRRPVLVPADGRPAGGPAQQLRQPRPVQVHHGPRLHERRRLHPHLVGPQDHRQGRAGQGGRGHVPLRRQGQALPAGQAARPRSRPSSTRPTPPRCTTRCRRS